jgi:hypothetical protein
MSRYKPLTEHLRRQGLDRWAASFEDIEKVLGSSLPESARKYPAWWANQKGQGHSQAAGWQNAGWRTRRIDLAARRVEFERAAGDPSERRVSEEEEMFARASEYLGFADRGRIVREAMRALIEREAARRLARLGGTMPDLEPAPRRVYR